MWDRRRTPGKGVDGCLLEVLTPDPSGLVTSVGFAGFPGRLFLSAR